MTILTVKTPTLDEMRAVATELGFVNLSDGDLLLHLKMLEGGFQGSVANSALGRVRVLAGSAVAVTPL